MFMFGNNYSIRLLSLSLHFFCDNDLVATLISLYV